MLTAERKRWAGGIALFVVLATLLLDLDKLVMSGLAMLGYPYDLDYGEGIVWQQMSNIVAGIGYSPLQTFPAIVYHYPPVYHLVVAGTIGLTGLDPLASGRLMSLLSTLVAMALAGWLAHAAIKSTDRRASIIGAVVAGLMFGASPTVLAWASLMRVDMLATAFTLAGLYFTLREMRSPSRFPLAAILFALAVYTKQTAIVAPAAAFAALWIVRPQSAWRFLLTCGSLGIAALVAMMIWSHGGFLRHVVGYNINRFDPDRWRLIVLTAASQTVTLAIATIVTAGIMRDWLRQGRGTWRARVAESPVESARLLIVIYFLLRVAGLPLTLKSGASDNYLIDLFSAAAVLAGIGVAAVAQSIVTGAPWPRALLTLLVLIGLPVQASRLVEANPALHDGARRADNDKLAARIAAADRPVISDNMVLLRRGGQPVLFEPAIAAELAHSGLYDEPGFIAMIRRKAFAFFVTEGASGSFLYVQRYNPAVDAAIREAYPRTEQYGSMVVHLPAATPLVSPKGRAVPPPR